MLVRRLKSFLFVCLLLLLFSATSQAAEEKTYLITETQLQTFESSLSSWQKSSEILKLNSTESAKLAANLQQELEDSKKTLQDILSKQLELKNLADKASQNLIDQTKQLNALQLSYQKSEKALQNKLRRVHLEETILGALLVFTSYKAIVH